MQVDIMNMDIITSAGDIKREKILGKTVVVIDMLRATSVITTAAANSCREVIPVLTIEDALELAKKYNGNCILGGERKAVKIEGFNCSNSPLEYTKELVENKSIILTTTNGTRAIKGCEGAKDIFIGCMLNALKLSEEIMKKGNDIVLVNAGTYDQFSMDDFICSGYIIDCILNITGRACDIELSDICKTAHYVYEMNKDIKGFIKNASHYKRIESLGLLADLEYCVQKSIIDVVPVYKDGVITA